ncbi:MAG: serine/threonine-protein kinase [Bacteroidota bacterium]
MERWTELKDLVAAALELPPEKRESFVEERCNGDSVLQREALELLGVADEPHILDKTGIRLPSLGSAEEKEPAQDLKDVRLGPYLVGDVLGQGGMGRVYRGRRVDETYERDVAIKVLRYRPQERQLVRFEEERRLLARLTHPNVAQIVDGGVTPQGGPYFVMEYVEGTPLLEYCDVHRLTVEERIELFVTVCDAVQYAHQNLIIHRDLKPSNILVTKEGVPKLLDFGIAKTIGETDEAVELSETEAHVMTPEYASPEQVRGESITTATDIYSLGVVLYRLLVGVSPYEADRSIRFNLDLDITAIDPQPASTSVLYPKNKKSKPADERAASRGLSPRDLKRRLKGDLDAIVAKALRKSPHERYQSAERLADDLRRHLKALPVSAHRGTLTYRARKFVRRHSSAVFATTVGVIVTAATLVIILMQSAELRTERDRAERARDQAEGTLGYLESLFDLADPEGQGTAAPIPVESLLDEGMQNAALELSDQPQQYAKVLNMLSELYLKLGAYDKAEQASRMALEVRNLADATEPADLAQSYESMAAALRYKGAYSDADSLFRQALLLRASLQEPPEKAAKTRTELAFLLHMNGQNEQAEGYAREGLAGRISTLGRDHMDVAESYGVLALVTQKLGNYEEASSLFEEALDTIERTGGPTSLEYAFALANYATLLLDLGEYERAEPMMRQSLTIKRIRLGEDHPSIGISYNQLASLARRRGNPKQAVDFRRRSIDIQQSHLGDAHPEVAKLLGNLASDLDASKAYPEAVRAANEALRVLSRAQTPNPAQEAIFQGILAVALRHAEDYEAAVAPYERAVELFRGLPNRDEAHYASTLIGLGKVYVELNQLNDAEAAFREALERRQTIFPPTNWRIGTARRLVGEVLVEKGQYEEAEQQLRLSLAELEEAQASERRLGQTRSVLDTLYHRWQGPA